VPREIERVAEGPRGVAAFDDRGQIENGEKDHERDRERPP
jgi:hypothetical protein